MNGSSRTPESLLEKSRQREQPDPGYHGGAVPEGGKPSVKPVRFKDLLT